MTTRHRLCAGAFATAAIVLGAGAAWAGSIHSVQTASSRITPGTPIQITVKRGGSGNCGARLVLGDGNVIGPFGFGTNPRVFSHSFANEGVYTITAQPRKHGSLAKCNGNARTTELIVSHASLKPDSSGATGARPKATGLPPRPRSLSEDE